MNSLSRNRRQFLRFLSVSPLFSQAWSQPAPQVITSAKDALSVMDMEAAARKAMRPAHWYHMSGGVDDDATIRANREAFKHFQLRPRLLVDVSKPDLRTELFGTVWDTPIFLAPVGSEITYHPEGELAVARAAKAKKALQILATGTAYKWEEVTQALGRPPWFQLYMPEHWNDTEKLVRQVETGGCPVLVWTVDEQGGRNSETDKRGKRLDTGDCSVCHKEGFIGDVPAKLIKPMIEGIGEGRPPVVTWEYVDRLKKLTKMKLVLKGIQTAEDAKLCREHGVDGIYVSNHGGRSAETCRATIDSLVEVVDAVGNRIPVMVDSGFRRGTDIYKALALGARMVGIGRPFIYGLAAFGQEGVERVLDILRAELQLIMRQCGTPSIAQITRASIVRTGSGV
jgi:isopentenyl diphosphate isomerase/L-lactate dehydrogenase-like FMN-dependent dehydrogenase